MKRSTKLGLGGCVVLLAWIPYQGTPTWWLANDFHYVVDLNTVSFPAGSKIDRAAQLALSDWQAVGATSFRPGFRRADPDFTDHFDGFNAWAFVDDPAQAWLAVTFVNFQDDRMLDCDIWFNGRSDFQWAVETFDPCVDHPFWPVDVRAIARHETGHALGFDHEGRTLSALNGAYTAGAGIAHGPGSGMLPHAEDKEGCRTLYPRTETVVNVMATRWREPAAGRPNARFLDTNGIWAPGSRQSVECYLENQSNIALPGGESGLRVAVYLSDNPTISTADHRVAEHWFETDWPAQSGGHVRLDAFIPTTLPAGSYHVGVLFDSSEIHAEQFETDNACVVGFVEVPSTGRFASFGSGCGGTHGKVPRLSGTGTPRAGEIVTVRVDDLPVLGRAWLLLGLSNVQWGPYPLPLALDLVGMPGCRALVSADVVSPLANFGGVAIWSAPFDTVPVGLNLYVQAVAADSSANALGLITSDALHLHVGN